MSRVLFSRVDVGGVVLASLLGAALLASSNAQEAGVTRVYYVAADEVDWNYVPTGANTLTGEPIDATNSTLRVFGVDEQITATIFKKAVYREYTDSTFTDLKPRPSEWEHLGLLGPVFRGEVGDTIRIVFKNNTVHPVSMHPHGVLYDKDSEGAPYSDGTTLKHDDGVPTGELHTYLWPIPERAGPGPNQPNSIVWPYHSHTHEVNDVNGGLIGAMIITRAGWGDAQGRPTDVDREFVVMFGAQMEQRTNYFEENLERYTGSTAATGENGPISFPQFGYASINGFMYSNMPLDALTMDEGDRVRWYVFTSTSFDDLHTPTWHGGTVLVNNRRTDVLDVSGPLLMATADMIADNPGIWQFHCHFGEHMENGMTTRYQVRAAGEG